MGQGVGELNVGVTARTGKASKNIRGFNKDLKKVKPASMEAGSGLSSLSSNAGVAAAGVLALGAALVVVRRTMQSMADLDVLGKTADKLGIATGKLAGLRLAAEQTGVATSSIDVGLQRMVRRLSEAAQGTGETRGALRELNLDAKRLAKLTPDEQFREITRAMSKIPSQADRVRLAFKLFDTEGVALVNTMKLGAEGLDNVQKKAERLGIALDRNAIRRVEEANDAIGEMQHAWAGVGNELAITFAPALSKSADVVSEFLVGFRRMAADIGIGSMAMDEAAEATARKEEADKRAAIAADVHAKAIAKQTAEYMKLIKAERDRQKVAELGQAGFDLENNERKFGRGRALSIEHERERADQAEAIRTQEEQILALKKRNADFNKTQLQKERDDFLASAETRELQNQGRQLYAELEAKEKARKAKEEADKAAEERSRKAAAEAERTAKEEKKKAEAEAKRVQQEAHKAAGQVGTAGAMDARSAEGFAQLQSSANRGIQAKMLAVNEQQLEKQDHMANRLEELASNAEHAESVGF